MSEPTLASPVIPHGPQDELTMTTECCGVPIRSDERFCAKCGWEARVQDPTEAVIASMRGRALVAGQCSVEDPDNAHASMAAAEAEFLTTTADQLDALLVYERQQQREDIEIRRIVWLNHGCPSAGLYGDDGEMQCNNAGVHQPLDFKRQPLNALVVTCLSTLRDQLTQARQQHAALEAEVARAMQVLNPSVPESGLEDACRQRMQALISCTGNCDTLEAQLARLHQPDPPASPQRMGLE